MGTVEEDILTKAKKKMALDHVVIQRMDTSGRTVLDPNASNATANKMFSKVGGASVLLCMWVGMGRVLGGAVQLGNVQTQCFLIPTHAGLFISPTKHPHPPQSIPRKTPSPSTLPPNNTHNRTPPHPHTHTPPHTQDELSSILRFGAEQLFKEDDKAREEANEKLLEEDIDDILARAELVNTEDAVKNEAADGLLNAFNVATFKTGEDDAAFWDRLIPQDARPKEATEELGVRGARLRTMEASARADELGRKRSRHRLRAKVCG